MNFARFRPKMAVLLALGALALAALLAGGCAAPDDGERAQFAVVTGVVLDNNNNPVPGALVTVAPQLEAPVAGGSLGTRNFFGSPGPFVTGPDGRFFIPGIKVSETAAGVVVLNLQATAPGFLSSYVVVPAPRTANILGRDFVAGIETRDIVITQETVSGLVARLVPPGQVVSVGAGGLQGIQVSVRDASTGVSVGTATVNIPAGSIQTTGVVQLALTGVTGTSLAAVAAPPPARVPTVGNPAPPQSNVALGSGVVSSTIPLAGIDIRALGAMIRFMGPKPTVSMPIPAGLTITGSRQIPSSVLAVIYFNETTGAWELVPNAITQIVGNVVTFAIGQNTGTYALVIPATWNLGTPVFTSDQVTFPPIAGFNGYVAIGRIDQDLAFNVTVGTPIDSLLRTAYSALTGELAGTPSSPAPLPVVVPPGASVGRFAREVTANVSVIFGTVGTPFTGTRRTWLVEDVTVPQAPTIPPHLQGHVQGGATGG